MAFYGDRKGIFVRHDDHWTVEKELAGQRGPTQCGRTLEQLGITYIAANSPQAKGRVERLWGVLQDRLVSELPLAGACDLASANRFLRRFISDYNRRCARLAPFQLILTNIQPSCRPLFDRLIKLERH